MYLYIHLLGVFRRKVSFSGVRGCDLAHFEHQFQQLAVALLHLGLKEDLQTNMNIYMLKVN